MSTALVEKTHRENVFRRSRLAVVCESGECQKGRDLWRRILKRTVPLRFHGSNYCFPDCFERELRRCLQRLSLPSSAPRMAPRRLPIGLLMLSRGVVSSEQLHQALQRQKQAGVRRIGEWLSEMSFAREPDVAAALAMQWSCPLIRKLPPVTDKCGLPTYLSCAFRMVPFHFSSATRSLHIAFADEIAYHVLVAIERMLELKTEASLTTRLELDAALARMEESKRPAEKVFEDVRGLEEIVRVVSGYAGGLRASEVRVVTCGDFFWVRMLGSAVSTDLIFSRKKLCVDWNSEAV
jgi:hypothetical protein